MKSDPRALIERLEATASLPAGDGERFSGYGVMGLPFRSGHVLALRRFAASSVGPAYASVWHRAPNGDWILYSSIPARQSCARFFGAEVERAVETPIEIEWTAPNRMNVTMHDVGFEWEVEAAPTAATRFMNATGRLLPDAAWQNPTVLGMMEIMAGSLLKVGRAGLHGRTPNGQRFIASPRTLWSIVDARARLAGDDFGSPGPVEPQARLGDFWIPQRGILAIGQSFFDSFNPQHHSAQTSRSAAATD